MLVDEGDHFLNGRSSSAWAKYADALRRISFAQAQFADLALQRLDPLLFVRRRAGPLALVALGLPDPASQRLRRTADLRRDRANRRPLRGVLPFVSNTIRTARSRTSGAYLGDACFVMMTSISQEMGPPVNPVRFKSRCGSVVDWLTFSSRKRMHSTLGYTSPMAFEENWRRQQETFAA